MCPRGLDIDKLPKVVCPQKLNQICPGRMKPSGDIDHENLAVERFDFWQQGEKLVVRESDWFFGQDMFAGIDCGLDLRGVEVGRRCYDQSVNILGLNEFRLIGLWPGEGSAGSLESGIAAADGGSFRVVESDWVKSRNFQAGIDQFQPAMTKPKDADSDRRLLFRQGGSLARQNKRGGNCASHGAACRGGKAAEEIASRDVIRQRFR